MNLNKNKPLVTVGIPAYNHEEYIEEAIRSVINQTYENIELIIINDGSKDMTDKIINKLEAECKERFVNYIYLEQENKGVSHTLNKILNMAKGEYFIITSSDDTQAKNRVEEKINFFLENSEYDFCYTGYNDIRKDGTIIKTTVPVQSFELDFEDIIFKKTTISYFAYMAKTSVLKEIGGYINGIKIEDLELALRLTNYKKRAIYLNKALYNHRFHENNTVKKLQYMKEGMFEILEIYKENPKYNEALLFWQQKYKKRDYHEFINEVYNKIVKYNSSVFKIVIYGTGSFGKIIAALIPNSKYCFIDQLSEKKFLKFEKGEIYSKDSLYSMDFDYIFISPLWLDINIKNDLLTIYKIDSEKIIMFKSSELV